MKMRRRQAVVASAVLAVAAWLFAVPAPTEASVSSRLDVAGAEGYDFHTLLTADIVAGSSGNLVLRYTAGRAVDNGVLRIVLPRSSWPTDLRPVGALYDEGAPGAFSVRPGIPAPGELLPEPTRPSNAVCEPVGPDTWEVTNVPGGQLITIRGVTCAAGRELAIRFRGVQAPARAGVHPIPLVMSSGAGLPRLSVALVRVVPTPRTQLVVSTPASVLAGVPFLVLVTAVGPDGRPAVGYRGAVAIVAQDSADCTLVPRDGAVAYRFTAADRGTAAIMVQLDQTVAHRLRVYDVARKAVDGLSPPFVVSGPPPQGVICPVSYH